MATEGSSVEDVAAQVIAMVAAERGVPERDLNPASRLLEDLGMDGDDAVEFFAAFETQFLADLTPLHEHWSRHFDSEGFGWPDVRLNWLALAGAGLMCAGLSWGIHLGVFFVGVAALAAATALGWRARFAALPRIAITVGDLIETARTKRWSLVYGDGGARPAQS